MIIYILLSLSVLALIGLLVLRFSAKPLPANLNKENITIQIKGHTYDLEIANTPAKHQQGLMNRSQLAPDAGMLFIFDVTSIYPFWMKNTLIPLDIIWLSQNKEIVYIKENAKPCSNIVEAVCNSIIPLKPARYVIELNAGDVQKLNLKVGDKIDF